MDPTIPGYRIDGLIGRGGMGVVYRAEHLHLQRTVALKVLAPEISDDAGFRERFIRESRIAAGIDHHGIVTVYDAGESEGLLYIAMRYVEGTDLAALLEREGPLDPARALALLEQVASALDAAHERGLVHRDVKPANVLIQHDRCYLTDFGLTKRTTAATALTATGQFVGTISYVAPEQIRGGELDARTDVYALACVLFECLAGAPPFRRDSDVATLYAHLEEPPPRLTERRAELPGELDAVLRRALAKRLEDRPASCGELIAAARAAAEEPPTAVRPPAAPTAPAAPQPTRVVAPTGATRALPPSAVAPAPAPYRRHLAMLAGAGGLVALAAVIGVVALGGDGDGGQTDTEGTPPVEPVARVGEDPVGVAVRDGRVWVTNSGDGTVSLLDADGDARRDPVEVGSGPLGITVGKGFAWVANNTDGTVSRLNESGDAVGEPIRVGDGPRWIALGVGDRSVWVSNSADGNVSRLNVDTGAPIGQPIEVGTDPRGIGTTMSSVWVANSGDDTLTRIDVERGEVIDEPVDVGDRPEGLAIRDGVIWVANSGDDTVSWLDNEDGRPLGGPIKVGDSPFGVAVGDEFVFVTNEGDGTVTRIDPRSGEVRGDPIRVGDRPRGVRAEGGRAWVASGDGTVTLLEP